jgi:hypothetical protein
MLPNAETIYRQFRLLLPFSAYSGSPDADSWPMQACNIRDDGVWCVYNSYAGYSFRLWVSDRYCCLFGETDSESITHQSQYIPTTRVSSQAWKKVKRTLRGRYTLPSDHDLNFLLESRGPREEWRIAKPFSPRAVMFALEAIDDGMSGMKFTSPDHAELVRVAKTITGSRRVEAIARLVHLGLPLGEAEVRSLMGRYWDLKRAKRLALENGIHVVWNDSLPK